MDVFTTDQSYARACHADPTIDHCPIILIVVQTCDPTSTYELAPTERETLFALHEEGVDYICANEGMDPWSSLIATHIPAKYYEVIARTAKFRVAFSEDNFYGGLSGVGGEFDSTEVHGHWFCSALQFRK